MNKFILIILTAFLFSGCAAIKLEPQATRIVASPNPAPKDCKYLGQVVGNQGNFFTGDWTSNRNLEEGAMHDLKNQASKLGANYVQLVTNRAGNTGSSNGNYGSFNQTNVTNLGNAYTCPADSIGL